MKQFITATILSMILLSCKSKDSKTEQATSTDTSTTTNPSSMPAYNFARHDDIDVFMNDLASAASAGDKAAIARMTSFPFIDKYPQFASGNEKDSSEYESLAASDSTVFISKFDNLFIPDLINAMKLKKYRGFEKNEHVDDIIAEGEYLIMAEAPINKRQYALAIKKINGVYKIYRTAFSS